jgi:hypothetical protein
MTLCVAGWLSLMCLAMQPDTREWCLTSVGGLFNLFAVDLSNTHTHTDLSNAVCSAARTKFPQGRSSVKFGRIVSNRKTLT